MSPTPALPGWALEQAVDWLLRLDPPHQADAQLQQALEQWLAQDPLHRQAWNHLHARLQGSMGAAMQQLQRSSAGVHHASRQALLAPIPTQARRRKLLGSGLAVVLAGLGTSWLASRHTPFPALVADLHTGTGERLQQQLADGSTLLLDAGSAVDIAFSSTQRLVQLREGALIAQVSRLPGVLRPFTVQSAQGTAQALGTRFMVRQQSGSTLVQVLEHSVRITTASGQQRSLQQGESAQFTDTQITLLEPGSAPAAWADGLIDVRNQPLGEVIDALRPYQPGLLRISPEAAQLRIFGVFALEHPRQVLQDLVDTHPIRVRHWGQWLTLIDLAPPRT